MRNVFTKEKVAGKYDKYYSSPAGIETDRIEKELFLELLNEIHLGELTSQRPKMLDAGCGTGHWTEWFIQQGFELTGTDISPVMLELARSKNIDAMFLKADSSALPFPNEHFDTLASVTMLEFVDDAEIVLKEMIRVLKKGGSMLLGCLNANSVIGKNKESDKTFSEAVFFTPAEIEKMLEPYGRVKIATGLRLDKNYNIRDGKKDEASHQPAFIAVSVKKK